MKKFIYSAMAVAMLATTSCKDDFAESFVGEEATVEFSISTPEIGTRAFSDGTTATHLQYAVYDAAGNQLTALGGQKEIKGSTTVSLELTTGESYQVIFWADAYGNAENAPYTVDFANKKMTVNYTGAKSNDENRDAFYKYHTFTVSGAQTETIELRRPFAQLNIGTSDYDAAKNANYIPTQSYVKVTNIYSTLDLVEGNVSNPVEAVFEYADIAKDEVFPVDDTKYDYLAMNYLLVAKDKELVNVDFKYTNGSNEHTRTVGSVPVQRNYRTNIYGKLLTSTVDVNVEIKPEYNEEDYLIYNVVVDGTSYGDFATAAAKAMELNKPIELIQNVTIDADNTIIVPAGKTLTLNLNGYTLKGVSDQTGSNRNIFDVRGEMTVDGANSMTRGAAVGNGVIAITHKGTNMGWGSSTNVFNVTAGGVLNIRNTNAINFGGSDMAFVAHLNNWGEVTLNVENSTLESNYVAVRVFNSGYDMNNVTINNSTLKGGNYAFWVHNYTAADFGTQEKADAQKALLNFDIFNGTNTFEGKNDTPIRYGFTNSIYLDENGCLPVSEASALKEALEGGISDIYLAAGEYTFPASSFKAGQTLVCAEGTVFTGKSGLNINGATVIGATFSNPNDVAGAGTIHGTYKDCTFEGSETLRWCYSEDGKPVIFEDCVFKTDFRGVHFDGMDGDVIFKNCKINGFNAFGGNGKVTFEGCTFGNDKSSYNGLNMYTNIDINDCKFNFVSGKTNFIDCEGTGKTMNITNSTATLDGADADIKNFIGGSKIDNNTVVVDGTTL